MTRREFIAVAAASAGTLYAWPAFAAKDADFSLRLLLDSFTDDMAPADKLRLLDAIPAVGLSSSAQADRDVVLAGLRVDASLARRLPFRREGASPYPVSPFSGSWRKAMTSGADAELAERISAETDANRIAAAAGIVLPPAILERTIASVLNAGIKATPDVAQALWRQCAQLSACRASSADAPGLWRLPDGEGLYAAMLERQYGGRVTPADVHDRLREEVRNLGARMDVLLRKQGLNGGSIGERVRTFARQSRWLYSDDEAGRDRAVADMNERLDAVLPRLASLFHSVPADVAALRVRRMTAAEDAAGRSGYRAIPRQGSDGAYVVDLRDIGRRPMWSLPAVVHHELVPGHMMQLLGGITARAHPLRSAYAPAIAEGWAIYGEQLAVEQGAFEGDDPALLGHLYWQMFRLCRGLVDTGIHSARWSGEEARRMLDLLQGEPAYFAPFDQDIDQAIVNPGARAAEALSWLELTDLRRSFTLTGDIRDFHAAALDFGPMTLPLLAARTTDQQ